MLPQAQLQGTISQKGLYLHLGTFPRLEPWWIWLSKPPTSSVNQQSFGYKTLNDVWSTKEKSMKISHVWLKCYMSNLWCKFFQYICISNGMHIYTITLISYFYINAISYNIALWSTLNIWWPGMGKAHLLQHIYGIWNR